MKQSNKLLTAAVITGSALWAVQASAAVSDGSSKAQMQNEINSLQTQVQNLKQQVSSKQSKQADAKSSDSKSKKNGDPLTLGGGVVTEWQDKTYGHGQNPGGNLILDYFEVNAHGKLSNGITYGAEERFSTVNFGGGDHMYLHYGWAAYNFGQNKDQQVKGGFFQVPFGNLTYGYQTFWGNLTYYAGFTDNQAAGLGYKYQSGAWRFDADYFKNNNLSQAATYGAVPNQGYTKNNSGNLRLAYTVNQGSDRNVTLSVAGQGGQLITGDRQHGSQWGATAAVNAKLNNWTLQLQAVDYGYNVPKGGTNGGVALSRTQIGQELYGFNYNIPAHGQIYSANVAYDFHVNWGPLSKVQLYDNYGYLKAGKDYQGGNPQMNAAGAEFVAGPIYVWADVLTGRDSAMAFVGTNNGSWHTRYNLTAAYYFSGTFGS